MADRQGFGREASDGREVQADPQQQPQAAALARQAVPSHGDPSGGRPPGGHRKHFKSLQATSQREIKRESLLVTF